MRLSMAQLAKLLEFGITDSAIEKWEKNQNQPTPQHWERIVHFLGFDPELARPTGDLSRSGYWGFAAEAVRRLDSDLRLQVVT